MEGVVILRTDRQEGDLCCERIDAGCVLFLPLRVRPGHWASLLNISFFSRWNWPCSLQYSHVTSKLGLFTTADDGQREPRRVRYLSSPCAILHSMLHHLLHEYVGHVNCFLSSLVIILSLSGCTLDDIFLADRQHRKLVKEFYPWKGTMVTKVLTLLVESGTLYCLVWVRSPLTR